VLINLPGRTQQIKASEGVWGPPTSGISTPLQGSIPESPSADSFPDFAQTPVDIAPGPQLGVRGRTRAGTLPSRFSPAGGLTSLPPPASLISKTSRPTPSTSPFKPVSTTPNDQMGYNAPVNFVNKNTLLQRLRAGSMPQRVNLLSSGNPFGPSLFSTNWGSNRERTSTLASIRSSDGPASPAHSSFSRESLADSDVKTLDYLGLVDTPKPSMAHLHGQDINSLLQQQAAAGLPMQTAADLAAYQRNANRFRSYSVNAKEKYADDEDDVGSHGYGSYSGTMTPEGMSSYAFQEMVRQHNAEVEAFSNFANANRPRARTASVLDAPSRVQMRNYMPQPSRLDNTLTAADLHLAEEAEYTGLEDAVHKMHLKGGMMPDGDENGLDTPTRALWLGNIPLSTTVSSLSVIFSPFGAIESCRVLTNKNCGFVNFETIDSAMSARQHLNGKEIFPGAGPVRIGYANPPSASGTPGTNGLMPSPSPDPQAKCQSTAGSNPNITSNQVHQETSVDPNGASRPLDLAAVRSEILSIVAELGATEEDQHKIANNLDNALIRNTYEPEVPPVPEPSHNRVHDAPRLREIRKRIDNNTCSQQEIEDVALNMLDEIAELASDYLGNTVVQKLFEYCSENVRAAMLERIAPHLAEIGIHKNGTWAAQKIIDVARTPMLMKMVVDSLQPYAMALFLDQFGNYVMQGCLRYQAPLNDFIFEVMLSRLWELAQGRFGARAMRACLESHYATKEQQRMVAAAVTLHSVQLATNANGALLLTWFLDTCTFPRRRTVLAPRLVPHLVHLCTHKVAYLTVLKIINQRNEPEARDTILNALFFSANDKVLEDILTDQQCGSTLIFKVLTTPFFDEKIRTDVVQNVRNVLIRIKAQPQQGYKRLMDEVGLSTRNSGPRDLHTPRDDGTRPSSKHSNTNGHMTPHSVESPLNRPFYQGMPPGYDNGMSMQRSGSMDSGSFDGYHPVNPMQNQMQNPMQANMYPTSNPGMPGMSNMHHMSNMAPMTPQQMQYQQAMMAAASRQNNSYFPPGVSMNGGYPSPSSSMQGMDAFRTAVPSSMGVAPPMMPQAGFGAPPGFGMGNHQSMFQGYPMQYVQPGMAHNGAGGQGRRRMG
jgi:protein JSN1